jgi:hypothetical protein
MRITRVSTEDEKRFPSTMFHLGAELNSMGLGFGVYTSQVGSRDRRHDMLATAFTHTLWQTSETCVGRPGTYEMEDVDTARW